ncbi:hypothetical protein PG993_004278 [Apiospora rasikravindrae]|uniref:Uncharacterized protein n=1 Tax=Apiospora rasikravindrae TaxID=990691 RepID=A0ABR1TEQ4_9PEZI
MNKPTPSTKVAKPDKQPKEINMDIVALRLGDKIFCVSRNAIVWCKYIRDILERADEHIPRAISLEPAVSDDFREKALAYHQKSTVEHNNATTAAADAGGVVGGNTEGSAQDP